MQNNKYPDATKSAPTCEIHLNKNLFQDKTGATYKQQGLFYQPGDYYEPYVP